jgi:hypothetical protein
VDSPHRLPIHSPVPAEYTQFISYILSYPRSPSIPLIKGEAEESLLYKSAGEIYILKLKIEGFVYTRQITKREKKSKRSFSKHFLS